MKARVVSLHIYPIKSCAAVNLNELSVLETGPAHDREWMIVDESGKFLTQRTHPQMALIQPRLDGDEIEISFSGLSFKLKNFDYSQDYETVQVWSSSVKALGLKNDKFVSALSDFMEQPVRLVRFGAESFRESKKSGVGLGAQVRFADRAPFLVTNLSSLQDLNAKLSQEIPITRFRSNIVLEGPTAWSEDHWKTLDNGSLQIEVTQNCGRCPIINIDPLTGVSPSKEVLAKLSTFRRKGNSVDFGVVGVHRGGGVLKVGEMMSVNF